MTVQIYVFPDSSAMAQNRKSFARSLDWDSSLAFPYEDTMRVLRCLFGNNSIIQIINFPL